MPQYHHCAISAAETALEERAVLLQGVCVEAAVRSTAVQPGRPPYGCSQPQQRCRQGSRRQLSASSVPAMAVVARAGAAGGLRGAGEQCSSSDWGYHQSRRGNRSDESSASPPHNAKPPTALTAGPTLSRCSRFMQAVQTRAAASHPRTVHHPAPGGRRQAGRQAGRQVGRQAGGRAGGQAGRQHAVCGVHAWPPVPAMDPAQPTADHTLTAC